MSYIERLIKNMGISIEKFINTFKGPITFKDGEKLIFHPSLANSTGVYLWTFPQKG